MLMCVWDTFFIFIWIFILYNGFIASPGWHWQGTVTPELRTQQPCCRNYCSSWLENLRIWVCFGSPAPPVPAVVRPVNISSLNPTLWLAGKNSLGIEAQCVRAFPAVYIFRCNKLPNKFLSLFSKCWSAARRDVNNLLFFWGVILIYLLPLGSVRGVQRPGGCWEEKGDQGELKN